MKALLVVDIQYDFLPGGALAVAGSDKIIPRINQLIENFDLVIATQDWHPADHQSFVNQHPGKQAFDLIDLHGLPQVLWPRHCVQGSRGATFSKELNQNKFSAIIRKGMQLQVDSYSGFFDNARRNSTGLHGLLQEWQVKSVYICGIAADFCVRYTANDALSLGYKTYVYDDAVAAINPEQYALQKEAFLKAGGQFSV